MPAIRPYDPSFAAEVLEHGRAGRSRAEAAAALGLSLADFAAWAAEAPAFAAALADADTLERAWWDAQPRLALQNAKPFKAAAWAKAMAQRFGRSADRPKSAPKPAVPLEPEVETIIDIPDNGRWRRRKGRGEAAA